MHEHSRERHAPRPFDPADPQVKVSGRVFGPEEVVSLVRASLDFWLTDGPETVAFQRALARRTGHRHAVLVNSGSSANLVALAALTSPELQPAYAKAPHRVAGSLETTDLIAERSFWVGCYPGLGPAALDHVAACFDEWRRSGARRAA
ncbi:MAG TPA: DegT/DnrJ/EryC1/StrS family aminotransferase [Gaiellales bacterium]|nr:DegT/DnrJ/EryC1/StrS family aminotransferase [Gaiellales bacterium]